MHFTFPFNVLHHKNRQGRLDRRLEGRLLLGFLTVFLGVSPAFSVSLPEAVVMAIDKSPEVLASRKQRLIIEQQIKQASSGYFPTIDISTGFGNEQTSNVSTRRSGEGRVSLPRTEARLVINQMLFDGFGVSNEIRRTQAEHRVADWTHQETVQTITLEAIASFLEVQKQRELMGLIRRFSTIQTNFLAKIQAWYEGGAGTIADVWQTQSRLALTRSSMTTIESQLGSAVDTFVRQFGFLPDTLDPVPSVSALLPTSVQQALEKGERFHPVAQREQRTLEAAEAVRDASRAAFWPSLQLDLETSHTTNVNGLEGNTQSALAMVRLNYNLFRGGNDVAINQEAIQQLEHARVEAEQVRRALRKNIEKSWRIIQELRKRLVFLEHHAAISKQVVDAYYEQFFADKRSLLNVLNAENELFTAQSNRVSGHYALLMEEYRFLANMGILDQALATPYHTENPVEAAHVLREALNHAKQPPAQTTASSHSEQPGREQPRKKHPLYGAILTSSRAINLYNNPQPNGTITKSVPPKTPLRILQAQDGWFQVVDPEAHQAWMAGPVTRNGGQNPDWQSGMITLDLPPDTTPSQPNHTNSPSN